MTMQAPNVRNTPQRERETQRAAAMKRRRSAYPAVSVILAATAPGLIFFSLVALHSSSWRYYGVAGASLILALVAIASLIMIRWSRVEIGAWLLIGGIVAFIWTSTSPFPMTGLSTCSISAPGSRFLFTTAYIRCPSIGRVDESRGY